MKMDHNGYLIKTVFVGDSITPIYRFRLYKKKNYWFPKLVWEERIHRDKINHHKETYDQIIQNYEKNLIRWN